MKGWIGVSAIGALLLSIAPSWATMDGSLASLTRDGARLSMEMGSTSPCPLPPGEFSGIQKGHYDAAWLKSLCVYEEMDSYLHHEKVREYIRLMPPEDVFAVYWEGGVDPKVFLGPAESGLSYRHGREWRRGRFLYIMKRKGSFVVDMKLIPKGLDPKTLAP
jgi:hypothetical protein